MTSKEKILVPKPRSSFYLLECNNCKGQTTVFSASTVTIRCPSCNMVICENTGGKAKINANIIKRLDSV
jgi:small subunit ribosomal protein S27e